MLVHASLCTCTVCGCSPVQAIVVFSRAFWRSRPRIGRRKHTSAADWHVGGPGGGSLTRGQPAGRAGSAAAYAAEEYQPGAHFFFVRVALNPIGQGGGDSFAKGSPSTSLLLHDLGKDETKA